MVLKTKVLAITNVLVARLIGYRVRKAFKGRRYNDDRMINLLGTLI